MSKIGSRIERRALPPWCRARRSHAGIFSIPHSKHGKEPDRPGPDDHDVCGVTGALRRSRWPPLPRAGEVGVRSASAFLLRGSQAAAKMMASVEHASRPATTLGQEAAAGRQVEAGGELGDERRRSRWRAHRRRGETRHVIALAASSASARPASPAPSSMPSPASARSAEPTFTLVQTYESSAARSGTSTSTPVPPRRGYELGIEEPSATHQPDRMAGTRAEPAARTSASTSPWPSPPPRTPAPPASSPRRLGDRLTDCSPCLKPPPRREAHIARFLAATLGKAARAASGDASSATTTAWRWRASAPC